MMKYKKGDLLRVTGNCSDHGYRIASIIEVIEVCKDHPLNQYKCSSYDEHNHCWYVSENEVDLYKPIASNCLVVDGVEYDFTLEEASDLLKRSLAFLRVDLLQLTFEFNDFMAVRLHGPNAYSSFYLSDKYDWHLRKEGPDKVLVPSKKRDSK